MARIATLNGVPGYIEETYEWEMKTGIDPVSRQFTVEAGEVDQLLANPYNAELVLGSGGESWNVPGDTVSFKRLHIGEAQPDKGRHDPTFSKRRVEVLDCRWYLKFGAVGMRQFNIQRPDYRMGRTGQYERYFYQYWSLKDFMRDDPRWTLKEILEWVFEEQYGWQHGGAGQDNFKYTIDLSAEVANITPDEVKLQGAPADVLKDIFNLPGVRGRLMAYVDADGIFYITDRPPFRTDIDPYKYDVPIDEHTGLIENRTKMPYNVRLAFPVQRRIYINSWETVLMVDEYYDGLIPGTSRFADWEPGDFVDAEDVLAVWFDGASLPGSDPVEFVRTNIVDDVSGRRVIEFALAEAEGNPDQRTEKDAWRRIRFRANTIMEHMWRTFQPRGLTANVQYIGEVKRKIEGWGAYYVENMHGYGYTNIEKDSAITTARLVVEPFRLSGYIQFNIELLEPPNLIIHITGHDTRFQHHIKDTSTDYVPFGSLEFKGYTSLIIAMYVQEVPKFVGDMHVEDIYTVPDVSTEQGTVYKFSDTLALYGARSYKNGTSQLDQLLNTKEVDEQVLAEKQAASDYYVERFTGSARWAGVKRIEEIDGEWGQIESIAYSTGPDGTFTKASWQTAPVPTPFARQASEIYKIQRTMMFQDRIHT